MEAFAPELRQPCKSFSPKPVIICLWILILAGLALRVVYPSVTVFCKDQAQLCALAQDIAGGNFYPAGLINSAKFNNPPGLGYILAGVWAIVPHPMAIMVFISLVNVAAVLAAWAILRKLTTPIAALWATAFFATSPWAIHYCRWIWAQDLLFPAALAVFGYLWLWMYYGRKWAITGVIISLAVLTHIHASGTTLAVAIFLLWLWARPKLYPVPIFVGVAISLISVAPYLAGKYFHSPAGHRMGYIHFWRSYVGGLMSVTGLGWNLEFRTGLPALKQAMQGRYWFYQAVMAFPAVLLIIGSLMGLKKLVEIRKSNIANRRSPIAIAAFLVIAIPTSFSLMGARTSPTYLPIWYPLPFIIMAWAFFKLSAHKGRLTNIWQWLMIFVMAMQISFFTEQLNFIKQHQGFPNCHLGRTYAGLADYVNEVPKDIPGDKLYMRFDATKDAIIQPEALAWMLRQQNWNFTGSGDALLRANVWQKPTQATPEKNLKTTDFLIAPWQQPHLTSYLISPRPEQSQ